MRPTFLALVCAALGLLSGSGAAAQPRAPAGPAAAQRMQTELHTYYAGEKAAAPLLVAPGVASVGVGVALLATDSSAFARGVAYPSIGLGVVEAGVGLVLYLRTDAQVAGLDRQLALEPRAFQAAESRRLRGVRDTFNLLLLTESVVAGVGAGLLAVGGLTRSETARGVGLGLVAQSTVLFFFDTFALARATRYLGALDGFAVAAGGESGLGVSYGGRF